MQLPLSTRSPLNTTICLPSGQALYKITTPWSFANHTSIIYRVTPPSGLDITEDSQDQYTEIGRILHKTFKRSIITFDGKEQSSAEFFNGRAHGHKTWEAADGCRYMWKLNLRAPTLHRVDTEEQVASIVIPNLRSFKSKSDETAQVILEVADECRSILDAIVVTLVHVENIRVTKKRIAIIAAVV